ncbi:hypothetical protein VNO77_24741 [Canavalia gladiata]|uniref:Uncharacterized protein n=1 Tax=Canavalia gladiata TaxID=3824 RepID=A0AAN9QCU7_CANGL
MHRPYVIYGHTHCHHTTYCLPYQNLKQHLDFQFSSQCSSEEADIMDFDFRASFHSVKHLSAVQAARLHVGRTKGKHLACVALLMLLLPLFVRTKKHDAYYVAKFEGSNLDWSPSMKEFNCIDFAQLGMLAFKQRDNEKPEDDPNFFYDYSAIHYSDVENDGQSDFQRCPFCDFEIEVPLLCSNFEEEHCSALKNVVCPVCEESLGKDAIMQFTHSSSQKTEKSSIWSGNSAMFGKKSATRGNKHESIPDPLLSQFVCNMPVPNPSNIHPDEDSSSCDKDIVIPDAKRSGTDAADMGDEQDQQERSLRAAFVQQLVFSTILE